MDFPHEIVWYRILIGDFRLNRSHMVNNGLTYSVSRVFTTNRLSNLRDHLSPTILLRPRPNLFTKCPSLWTSECPGCAAYSGGFMGFSPVTRSCDSSRKTRVLFPRAVAVMWTRVRVRETRNDTEIVWCLSRTDTTYASRFISGIVHSLQSKHFNGVSFFNSIPKLQFLKLFIVRT